jgi:beta-ureidopropionase / N-carbamoyl-L-amino-acid hydrolase
VLLLSEPALRKNGLRHAKLSLVPGHDAVYVSKVVPTSMIFVPCAGGLSHNEAESITQADATAGAQVLLDAVLALDDRAAM